MTEKVLALAAELAAALAADPGAELGAESSPGAAGEAGRGVLVDQLVLLARLEAALCAARADLVARLHADFLTELVQDLADTLDQPAGRLTVQARRDAQLRGWLDEAHRRADRATAASVSLALGVSFRAADRLLDLAQGLDRHRPVRAALATGRLDQAQAATVLTGLTLLTRPGDQDRLIRRFLTEPTTPTARARLVRELRHDHRTIWDLPAHKLRPLIAREVAHLDPAALTTTEQRCHDERRIAYHSGAGHDLATLILTGPETALTSAYQALDHAARHTRRTSQQHQPGHGGPGHGGPSGRGPTLDQLRFDLAITAITAPTGGPGIEPGNQPGNQPATKPGYRPLVTVTVSADTLAGTDQQPAVLHSPAGDVPISADQARHLAHARWRALICDPDTGTAIALTPTTRPWIYRPNPATAALVRVTCPRFPGHLS